MQYRFDTSDTASYEMFLRIKGLPAYSIRGTVAEFANGCEPVAKVVKDGVPF